MDSKFATPYLLRPLAYGRTSWFIPPLSLSEDGTALGGVIIDGGRFDWTHPEVSGTDWSRSQPIMASYFTKAAGEAAFVTRIRAVLLLRDTGIDHRAASCVFVPARDRNLYLLGWSVMYKIH